MRLSVAIFLACACQFMLLSDCKAGTAVFDSTHTLSVGQENIDDTTLQDTKEDTHLLQSTANSTEDSYALPTSEVLSESQALGGTSE